MTGPLDFLSPERLFGALRRHEARRQQIGAVVTFPGADLTGRGDDALVALQAEIMTALSHRPVRDFALNAMAEVEGDAIRGVVRLRMNGRAWRLDTIEATLLAIHVRLAPDMPGRDLFADGLSMASREAEQKVDALRRYGVAVVLEGEGA